MISVMALLASQMLMISDRHEFWDANALSKNTHIHLVDEKGKIDSKKVKISSLSGKKILLLIHGYNNDKNSVLSAYFMVKDRVDHTCVNAKGKIYDEVIGYVWPGYQNRLEFYAAEGHAEKVKDRMSHLLSQIGVTADQVDVMAHSMGNFLFLESLNDESTPSSVSNFFSLGAAVDDESIETGNIYGSAIEKCHDVYVAYSKEDDVLKYLYSLAELDRALGSVGVQDLSRLPPHIQLVNCTDVVSGHSQYTQSPQLFSFIRDRLLGVAPLPEVAKSVKLLADNQVVVVVPVVSSSVNVADAELVK